MINPARIGGLLALTGVSFIGALPAYADSLVADLLTAADRGQCIEDLVHNAIRQQGPEEAERVVRAALTAHAQVAEQQRALGCEGDIAVQAIAAGADPKKVLDETAAGL